MTRHSLAAGQSELRSQFGQQNGTFYDASPTANTCGGMRDGARVQDMRPLRVNVADAGTIEAVVAAMKRARGEPWAVFRDRRGDLGRNLVLRVARRRCGLTLAACGAQAGGLENPTLSKAITRMQQRRRKDSGLRRLQRNLEREMSSV
jgi:hypothetical protein